MSIYSYIRKNYIMEKEIAKRLTKQKPIINKKHGGTDSCRLVNFRWQVDDVTIHFKPSSIFTFEETREHRDKVNTGKDFHASWEHRGKRAIIPTSEMSDSQCHLQMAIPTPDHKHVLAIFSDYKKDGNNAILYNMDGSIRHRIEAPKKMLSQNANNQSIYFCFMDCYWIEKANGQMVPCLRIRFDMDYWEDRVFDVESCELGELYDSGRY